VALEAHRAGAPHAVQDSRLQLGPSLQLGSGVLHMQSTSHAARTLAQVLVTATRNQAIDAVVVKLSRVEGSLLVFGREERLGPHAQQYQLKERVKRHPHVAAWLDHVQRLQALRESGAPQRAAVLAALQAALAQVQWCGWARG